MKRSTERREELAAAAAESARSAGLIHASDHSPGIRRLRKGSGFTYLTATGSTLRDEATLKRIKSLAIPPAWEDVWICAAERGHIQAVGRDARGRKQYRYHPRWREVRDDAKYGRTIAFAKALPAIRRRVRRDLNRKGLPREKILAAVVQLLESTLIRVGNDEYAKGNDSYGLTTLQDRHATVRGSKIEFRFRGKSGVQHAISLHDRRLARIVKQSQELPGEELLQYVDETGQVRDITSGDVNDYLREIAGSEFTAKDFRTWAGTVLASRALSELEPFTSKTDAKKKVVRAIEQVAKKLGNTPSVCRKCYVHPAIVDSYLDGELVASLRRRAAKLAQSSDQLNGEEAAVLRHLQRSLARPSAGRKRSSKAA